MRGINYIAGLGTILLFISAYSFKAAFNKRAFKEEKENVPVKNSSKVFLIFFSIICLVLGLFLISKSLKII